jgi:hypothetical protein
MKNILIYLSLFIISACGSTSLKRNLANVGEYKTFVLNNEYTFRVEDQNQNLEPLITLAAGDIVEIRIDNPTGPRTYINDGDIFQSNGGWFQDVNILAAKELSDEQREDLNEKQLFVSVSIVNRASELREGELGLDCQSLTKGCLLKRGSDTVIIFFRGWVPDNRFGSRKQVPSRHWTTAARQMMLEGTQLGWNIDQSLAQLDLESSIFTMASSHLSLSMDEMDRILELSGASKLIFASHSGGQVGLRQTILAGDYEYWQQKVKAIWMLDNFYSAATTSAVIYRNFYTNHPDKDFLRENCFGFVTDHNLSNYRGHYKSFCPNVLERGVGHSDGVVRCLPDFEKGEACSP